jgi:hypothetical protein
MSNASHLRHHHQLRLHQNYSYKRERIELRECHGGVVAVEKMSVMS